MVFDTTYHTNKYNLICAPFVGVNHYWQNVIFGCAFLLEETSESFKWLVKAFLESIGSQLLIKNFTDQDLGLFYSACLILVNKIVIGDRFPLILTMF